MRIKITLKPERPIMFQKSFNEGMTAFIYRMIRLADKGFGDDLHDRGYRLGDKSFRFFTYSNILCRNIQTTSLFIDENIEFYFSSLIEDIVINFVKGVQKTGKIILYGTAIPVLEISRIKDDYKFEEGCIFNTLSPVIMQDTNRKYLSPEEMQDKLVNNLIEKYYVYNHKMPKKFDLEIKFLNARRETIVYKGSEYEGYSGRIAMAGNSELIQIAYQAGLGTKNGQGCGMLEKI